MQFLILILPLIGIVVSTILFWIIGKLLGFLDSQDEINTFEHEVAIAVLGLPYIYTLVIFLITIIHNWTSK